MKDVDGISVFKESQENVGTPLKFNMEPENEGLEDDFPFQLGDS